jgi:hypothetical protein
MKKHCAPVGNRSKNLYRLSSSSLREKVIDVL